MHAVARVMGAGAFTMCACSLLTDLTPLEGGDASTLDGAALDHVTTDASPDVDTGPCPSLHGSAMALVSGVCIDATHATKSMYQEFLNAALPVKTDGPCSFQTSYVPMTPGNLGVSFASEPSDAPVIGVNWCDARDYCAWAGKQLCGGLDGGAVSFGQAGTMATQYTVACTQDGLLKYPYGASAIDGYCNLNDSGMQLSPNQTPPNLAPVAGYARCQLADSGVYDLLGNAYSWTNACDNDPAEAGTPNGACAFVGGDWLEPYQFVDCTATWGNDRSSAGFWGTTGIRCCEVPQ